LLKHPIDIDILNQCLANDNSSTLPSSAPRPMAGAICEEEQSTNVAHPLGVNSVSPHVVGEELNNNSSPSNFANVEGKSTSPAKGRSSNPL